MAQDAPPAAAKPEPLTAEQRAQAYKLLFQIRDAAATMAELREQSSAAAARAKQAQDEFAALHQKLSAESGCRLNQDLEWQCQPAQ